MEIIDLTLSSLVPYANNPRENSSAVDGVAESIRQFGFQQPIVVDSRNEIVCGHTRFLAAQKLGLEKVPCVRVDALSSAQIKAYRLLDNKLHEKSTWNVDLLRVELGSFEFDFTPFDVEFNFEDADEHEAKQGEVKIPTSFQLIVECEDEESQAELYERLVSEGYKTRICNLCANDV